ncbi:MAG: hypothetical protein JXB13_22045 [Phycisphaerae bacterium]|nr:hypothetical protein [Phycisphaerae bacterium]
MKLKHWVRFLLLSVVVAGTACTPKAASLDDPQTRDSLALLMPERIGIMPFTRVESFDDDNRPDGIAMLLRPINVLGDPVNIVGQVRAELYEYTPASGLRTGPRLAMWEVLLNTKEDQRRYWSSTTQMYEFHLELNTGVVSQRPKYVLAVTYNTPLGTHLTDEYILEVPIASEPFASEKPG